ncbi:MAG: hypothetical protein JW934_11840 [Anaerolineae bacterium]|nr:hypothetical protein [Anaerolineae bacterium]
MKQIEDFTDIQKDVFKGLISDLGGPTSTHYLLSIIEDILLTFKPDWENDPLFDNADLRQEIEVCMAALNYADATSLCDGK